MKQAEDTATPDLLAPEGPWPFPQSFGRPIFEWSTNDKKRIDPDWPFMQAIKRKIEQQHYRENHLNLDDAWTGGENPQGCYRSFGDGEHGRHEFWRTGPYSDPEPSDPPASPQKAMATNPGSGFRERERLKRKASRWVAKLEKMPATERAFIRAALDTIDRTGEA